ncbi:hypothetical protein OH76DRAFT_469244 [Lentinus brumalis]|uniref:Uncharacterized protein n=1 Tax=Lentinus brumalis TaxID=2498619 RepID=A0A371DCM7_9APHY|nr:hypothetical protein OH76DRAFT_469244 [Polyporus brumalis]
MKTLESDSRHDLRKSRRYRGPSGTSLVAAQSCVSNPRADKSWQTLGQRSGESLPPTQASITARKSTGTHIAQMTCREFVPGKYANFALRVHSGSMQVHCSVLLS